MDVNKVKRLKDLILKSDIQLSACQAKMRKMTTEREMLVQALIEEYEKQPIIVA